MFTGIVEAIGVVEHRQGPRLRLNVPLSGVKVGDSTSVDGVCLTVTAVEEKGAFSVFDYDVSEETDQKSTLGELKAGFRVNVETAVKAGQPLGGHFVLGHVDATGEIAGIERLAASATYKFAFPLRLRKYLVPKGSVAVNGVSLTVADLRENTFTVAVIPHTEKNTSFGWKKAGDRVNLEVDILAKHVERLLDGWKASAEHQE